MEKTGNAFKMEQGKIAACVAVAAAVAAGAACGEVQQRYAPVPGGYRKTRGLSPRVMLTVHSLRHPPGCKGKRFGRLRSLLQTTNR